MQTAPPPFDTIRSRDLSTSISVLTQIITIFNEISERYIQHAQAVDNPADHEWFGSIMDIVQDYNISVRQVTDTMATIIDIQQTGGLRLTPITDADLMQIRSGHHRSINIDSVYIDPPAGVTVGPAPTPASQFPPD